MQQTGVRRIRWSRIAIGLFVLVLAVACVYVTYMAVLFRDLGVPLYRLQSVSEETELSAGTWEGKPLRSVPIKQVMYRERPAAEPANGVAYAQSAPRMLIKTGNASLEVVSVDAAGKKIDKIAAECGGFVTSSEFSAGDEVKTASISFRVPSKNFQAAFDKVLGLGRMLDKSVQGNDVTEEFTDVQAQLRNLKAREEQFLVILRSARQVKDVLAVQRELGPVRQEIERLTGREKFLRDQVALSTINVELTEPTTVVGKIARWDLWRTLKGAFYALDSIARALVSLVIWLIVLIPFWILIALVLRLVRRVTRRERG